MGKSGRKKLLNCKVGLKFCCQGFYELLIHRNDSLLHGSHAENRCNATGHVLLQISDHRHGSGTAAPRKTVIDRPLVKALTSRWLI